MRPCKDCKTNERYKSKSGKTFSYCLACQNIRNKRYQEKPGVKQKIKKNARNHSRRKNGFTPEMFNDMLFDQDFKCAICSVEIDISSHADHDHDTGKARGILCSSCNTLLGRLESKGFDWVDKAKTYLNI